MTSYWIFFQDSGRQSYWIWSV